MALWIGSVGYERYGDNREFAARLAEAGVERLVDVREAPISRRRGFAKSALAAALNEAGIEYEHVGELGNPKAIRDVYKAGDPDEGRARYADYLLGHRRDALESLVPKLHEKRTALMCLEQDPARCHRTVIIEALRDELGLELEVTEID